MSETKPQTTFATFQHLEIRAGRVTAVEPFPEARKPAVKLTLDFGDPVGVLQSSAQLTRRYAPEELAGRTLLAVVNLPPRRIAGFPSQCLVLGVVNPADPDDVVLVSPDLVDTTGWELG
jgi:tRNA-binding protein